jgi:hypothetical protein
MATLHALRMGMRSPAFLHASPRLIEVVIQGFILRQRVQLAARLGVELADTLTRETELTTDLREALGLTVKAKAGTQDGGLPWLEVL